MSVTTPILEITDFILEVGGKTMLDCMQCGTCTAVCPWGLVGEHSPRLILRQAGLGLDGYEEETLWRCVTCGTCTARCPREVDIIDGIRSTRAAMQASGVGPASWNAAFANLVSEGNPWSAERSERGRWAEGTAIRPFEGQQDRLLAACCTHAHDPRGRKALRAYAGLLQDGSLGTLGEAESCCGEQALEAGMLEAFEGVKESNQALFQEQGVERMVVTSPHCLDAYRRHYDGLEVSHYTQWLDQRLQSGALVPSQEVPLKVTYHDPCYLGRHQGEYEAPRRVLDAIPGLERVEMPRNREQSLCCGGGGAGAWSEVEREQRFAILRVEEALETGAQVIATACPFCTLMLEDALKVMDIPPEQLQVLEVGELLARACPSP